MMCVCVCVCGGGGGVKNSYTKVCPPADLLKLMDYLLVQVDELGQMDLSTMMKVHFKK